VSRSYSWGWRRAWHILKFHALTWLLVIVDNPAIVSSIPEHKTLNRYNNIKAYDWSRVKVKPTPVSHGSFPGLVITDISTILTRYFRTIFTGKWEYRLYQCQLH
jgi:hypothetical protein